jgi:hypothetical protein
MMLAAIAAIGIKAFATSDYMLSALAIDPATTQKRLGDGFFKQKFNYIKASGWLASTAVTQRSNSQSTTAVAR